MDDDQPSWVIGEKQNPSWAVVLSGIPSSITAWMWRRAGENSSKRIQSGGEALARLASLDEEALLGWLSFLLAIHDVGKFSDGFQNLRPDLFQVLQGRSTRVLYDERHDTLGWMFAQDISLRFSAMMMLRTCGTFLPHGCLLSPGITAGPRRIS